MTRADLERVARLAIKAADPYLAQPQLQPHELAIARAVALAVLGEVSELLGSDIHCPCGNCEISRKWVRITRRELEKP